MKTHRLDAAPETVHWGFFDANLKPLITVDPGDEVVISTVSGPASAHAAPGGRNDRAGRSCTRSTKT